MAGVWYRTGTIAVTSGSKKITGTGTAWAGTQNGVAKGTLLLIPNGTSVDIYEIDYVESNTVLWLVDNYRGTTAAGKSYAIDITRTDSIPDFSRRLAATLSYHQANLDVLEQLYTSTAASITITAPDGTQRTAIPWPKLEQLASRTLTEMGAGTAATRNVGTAAGNLMEVGAFGIGRAATSNSELDTTKVGGIYSYSNMDQSSPSSEGGIVIVGSHGAAYVVQVAITAGSNKVFRRRSADGGVTWGTWSWIYTQDTVLGTVGQSGGVPTGAIIERGSNSDGEYVKFADGTQICNKIISGLGPINSQEGGLYRLFVGAAVSGVWAKPFSSKPFICPTSENPVTGSYSWLAPSGGVSATQVGAFNLFRATAESGVDYSIRLTAIGRWF